MRVLMLGPVIVAPSFFSQKISDEAPIAGVARTQSSFAGSLGSSQASFACDFPIARFNSDVAIVLLAKAAGGSRTDRPRWTASNHSGDSVTAGPYLDQSH